MNRTVKVVLLLDPDVSSDTETLEFTVELDEQIPWDELEWTIKEETV